MQKFILLLVLGIFFLNGCSNSKTAYEMIHLTGKTFIFSESKVNRISVDHGLFRKRCIYYSRDTHNSMPNMKLKLSKVFNKNKFYFTGVFKEYSGTFVYVIPAAANNYQAYIKFNIEKEKLLNPNKLYQMNETTLTFRKNGQHFTANINETNNLEEKIVSKLRTADFYFSDSNLLRIIDDNDDFVLDFLENKSCR